MTSQLPAFLNLARWLSAFLVLISHVRSLLFIDYAYLTDKSIPAKAFYLFTGLGHDAVIVFFVISGYLVGGLTWERWRVFGPELGTFASARISRIYTVLIPGLAAGLILDFIGLYWLNASALYTNPAQHSIVGLVESTASRIDTETFVGNIFMLQGILTSVLGSNGPLWSLAFEWWFYSFFAAFAATFMGRGVARAAYALISLAIVLFIPAKFFIGGIIWALGWAARKWIASGLLLPNPALGVVVFAGVVLLGKSGFWPNLKTSIPWFPVVITEDFILGASFVILMAGMSRMTMKIPLAEINERLAGFSFSVYVFHYPMIFLLVATAYQLLGLKIQVQPDAASLLYFIIILVLAFCYCYALSLLTERHTGKIRETIAKYLQSINIR